MDSEEKFIKWCKSELAAHGGKLILLKKKKCPGMLDYIAYYDPGERNIYVCTESGTPPVELISHELIHALDDFNGNRLYKEADKFDVAEIRQNSKIKKDILVYIRLERNTERKAMILLDQFNIEYNKKHYCRAANTVLCKYAIYYHYGVWVETPNQKEFSLLGETMPTRLLSVKKLLKIAPAKYKEWNKILTK